MKAIILAAGQGTRLRPYTNDKPKCMVHLAGKSLLHRQMEIMSQCGISDSIIVGGYCIERIDPLDAKVVENYDYDSTNMLSTLFCARDHMIPGEDLLISYGDIVYEPQVLQSIIDCSAAICVAADTQWEKLWKLRMDDPLSDAETFVFDKNQYIVELGKHPKSYRQVQAQYMGLMRIRSDKVADVIAAYDALDVDALYDGSDFSNMYMTSFLQCLIDKGWLVKACLVEGGWLEVDTAEDLNTYERMAVEGSLDHYYKCSSPS
ncbi:NTP transferase domain-containing protein [Halomonas nitroreducens]|uniref:Phosphocholine cytidylyltransferase family protein n=1 Tax=Halomonas nitroreducens TaxID=447425 RepID=A0A3S0JYS3_9GAMM|nr:phosphocholine cytidylyltransferase family protein [Halomonas nitroreducens]RTR05362.1 phosphocholine cytidylyltransferase family protein [Halomonas nitroreducens]